MTLIKDIATFALIAVISFPFIGVNQLGTDTIRVPTTFEPINAREWAVIEYKISSHRYKTINLLWAGFGGYVYMGNDFTDVMVKAEKEGTIVNVIIDGFSASMHAVVPCYASKATLLPSGTLYFHHSFFRDDSGKKIYDPNDSGDIARHSQCVSIGLLRIEGLQAILNHKAYIERYDEFSKTIIGSIAEDQS